tara:strand:+ start:65 stop:523 length:459 start_codon:yes stop_codon:yes gene_type:complete
MTSYTLKPYSKNSNDYLMIKKIFNKNNSYISLQYGLKESELLSLNTDIDNMGRHGWSFVEHSPENLKKLTPDTKKGNSQSRKIIVVISHEKGCIKGALRGDDGTITLMSSLSPEYQTDFKNKLIKSKDKEWKICQGRMIAPLFFWREIQNRI